MSDYETWQANRELDQYHAATDGADAERDAAFARIAALEAERDAMQRRAEMAEDDMLSAGLACDDLAARVTELEAERDQYRMAAEAEAEIANEYRAERDAARAEAGLLRSGVESLRTDIEQHSYSGVTAVYVELPRRWSRLIGQLLAALAGSGEQQP